MFSFTRYPSIDIDLVKVIEHLSQNFKKYEDDDSAVFLQATPRATTPTRHRYKMNGDDFKYEDVIRAPAQSGFVPQNTTTHYSGRPDSMFTTPTGYADSESGYSLESR